MSRASRANETYNQPPALAAGASGSLALCLELVQKRLALKPNDDVDVTPATGREDLERLAAAMRELGARLRSSDEPEGVAFPLDAEMLRGAEMWTLTTSAGDLDHCFMPVGTRGYEDLRREASSVRLGEDLVVNVASLRDVIRSKEAAGRDKDIAQLPLLRRTLERIRERERTPSEGER